MHSSHCVVLWPFWAQALFAQPIPQGVCFGFGYASFGLLAMPSPMPAPTRRPLRTKQKVASPKTPPTREKPLRAKQKGASPKTAPPKKEKASKVASPSSAASAPEVVSAFAGEAEATDVEVSSDEQMLVEDKKQKAASSKTAPPQKETASKKAVVEKVQAQPDTEHKDKVSTRGRAATEEGLKRKAASDSKYFHKRKEWQIHYPGAPDRDKLTQVITVMRRRKNNPLAENTIRWKGQSGVLEYNKPVLGGNALNTARQILQKVIPAKQFQWDKVDIDFVQGQRPSDGFDTPPAASEPSAPSVQSAGESGNVAWASLKSGNVALASLSAGSASVSVPSAWVGVASASGSVVDGPDYGTVLRFKAIHLARFPAVPQWFPPRGLQHAQGSHGAVVFAFNPHEKKDVAIKVLASDRRVDFFEELEALVVAAEHPCAVKLLDVVSAPQNRIGFVLERLGPSLLKVMQASQNRKRAAEGHKKVCWPLTQGKFEEGFRGLFSALAFLSDRHLAHSDIKPSNICFKERGDECILWFFVPGRAKLVLCDFGATTLRRDFGSQTWSRDRIEKKDGVEVTSKPYRAPELFFGMYDYDAQIDVWSLGVVMVESAMNDFLFYELRAEKEFREHFRAYGDTRGDLSRLKGLQYGPEVDWKVHDWDLVPKSAMDFLGPNAEALFRGTLRLNPEKRLSARAVLELPFFSRGMSLHVWDEPVASAPDTDFVVSAPASGPHETILVGDRSPCQLVIGYIPGWFVQNMLREEYWTTEHGWDWSAQRGTSKAKDRTFMKIEKAAEDGCDPEFKGANVKIQISGCTNKCKDEHDDRGAWNEMSLKGYVPPLCVRAWLEAFKCANEVVWPWIDSYLQNGPLKDFQDPKTVGANGTELLRAKSREWFGQVATIQLTKLHRHAEEKHMDGGAAILLLVLTLAGKRKLTFTPADPTDTSKSVTNLPGMVYLTSVCGVKHQVSYDGKSEGFHTPELGEIGISIAFRTSLFRGSPYMASRPGPALVWEEVNKMLQALHSQHRWKLPTEFQYHEELMRLEREHGPSIRRDGLAMYAEGVALDAE